MTSTADFKSPRKKNCRQVFTPEANPFLPAQPDLDARKSFQKHNVRTHLQCGGEVCENQHKVTEK